MHPSKNIKAEVEKHLSYLDAIIVKDINASNGEVLVFGKNGKAWQDLEIIEDGTYRLALRGVGTFKVTVGKYTFIFELKGNTAYTPPFYLEKGKYRLEITPIKTINLLKNPSFEKIFAGSPKGWNTHNNNNFKICFDEGYDGNLSLKVSTHVLQRTFSWIRSEPIKVKPGKTYLVITHMKVYNADESNIVVEGWRENKLIKQLVQCPPGAIGEKAHEWEEFGCKFIPNKEIDNIRVVLNAGWVLDKSKGEAITWFDDIEVIPLDEAPKLDVIWLYSTKTNQTIDQLFEVKEKPAEIVNYTKINPTLWKVKVNATKPFMLSFAEAYDPLWEARVYKDGKLVEKVRSIPLYSVINGFWINETGNLEIVIRYTPQDWFELGLMISATTFIGCIGYIFYDWRREKGDRWALKIERKIKEIWQNLRH